MIEMHCGMCEHDWLDDAEGYLCPACGSDETETLAEARTHNEVVQAREAYENDPMVRLVRDRHSRGLQSGF